MSTAPMLRTRSNIAAVGELRVRVPGSSANLGPGFDSFAVALPLLVVLRHTRWEKRMVLSSSLAILVVGLVLFVERALL